MNNNEEPKPEQYTQLQFPGMAGISTGLPANIPVSYSHTLDDQPPKEISSLGNRVASLEVKVATMMDLIEELQDEIVILRQRLIDDPPSRPGRKPKVMVQPNIAGVCGLFPDSDDVTCPHANVYRHQQGCRGTACVSINAEYYAARRQAKEQS